MTRKRCLRLGVLLSAALLVPACREGEGRDDDRELVAGERQRSEQQPPEQDEHDPLGANAACYVCHMAFVGEELTAVHLPHEIGCVQCHGTSEGHANDENIGATPPDKVFGPDQINPFCRTCHETHDVDPEKVIARWTEGSDRGAASQPAKQPAACTDCHGTHAITGG